MAADRPEGSNLEQSIAKRMGNRLRRMFGMENLHDGSREQFEEAHESIPEGGRPLQAETTTGRTGTASSLPDAGLSRPWSSEFEPFPTPGAGGGQSQGISGGGGGGSAGTGLEAEGLAGVAGANGGTAHTAPTGGSGPGHASPSGGGGGTGGGGGAHNGPNGGTASPLSNASAGLNGETHRPITDDDERVTGDEDKPIQGTVIEHPISSEGKLLVLKSFNIEGFPATHTPGTQPVSIPGIGSFLVDPLGNYTFTPAPNWHGQVPTIHYTVTDCYSTNNSSLNINIKPVDDSFTDNSERFVYNEDSGQHSGDLLKGSSSPDGPLSIKSFSVEGQQGTLDQPFVIAGKGTLTIHQDGTFDFQSAPNYNGPIPQATYTVTDGSGTDVQSTLNINIKPVDDSFTDNSERFVYNEDSGQHSGDLLKGSSSPDGPLSIKSFSVEGQQGTLDQPFVIAGKGTLTIHQDGTFDFQSAPNYNGPIPQATYTVTDGSGTDVQSTLNINIKPVDDSFTDNSERFVYNEDSGQHSGDLLKGSSSPDGPLSIKSFSVEGQQGTLDQPFVIAGKGTLTIHQDGTFDFQSAPNYNGPIPQATYTVTDGSGTDVQSTLNINIKPVDDSFTDNSERFVYNEDSGQHSGDLLKGSSSPDGPLSIKSFSVEGQQGTLDQPFVIAGKGTLTIHQDGTFDFQSAPNYNGPIPQATYTVTDGSGTDVQSTLNINIKPVDDSFTDNSERFVYNEDSGQHSGDLLKGSSSPDGPLSIKSFSVEGQQGTLDQPFVIAGKGTLTIHQDGTFDFQSAPNYNGPIPQATYTVTDGSGTDVQSTLNINIKPVDDSFTDNSERFVYNEDSGQHSGDLLKGSSSPDGPLSIKSFSVEGQQGTLDQPFVIAGKGTLTIHQDGTFDFQSAPNYNGPIPQATYTVTDGSGTDVQSTLNINIKPVDDSFTDNSERFVYNEDSGQHSGDLLKGSSSPDGPLSIKSFSVEGQQGTLDQPFVIAGKGTLTIHQDGTFDFQSAPNYNGPIPQATYTVTDGSGKDVQSTLNINIKPVDDSFTDNSERFVYNEDSGQHSGDLLKGSSSPDGPLSIKSFSVEGQQGTLDQPFVIAGKGTLTIHQDGTFDFQSAPNYNGPIPQATYTVTDGSGTDVQSTLNINIKPVDDSFTDNSERFVYNEDSGQHSGDLLKGSSSPDGPLSIKSFSVEGQQGTLDQPFVIAGKGTLTIHQDGTFDFQSAPNYNGPIPQATYTVTDGSGTDVQSTLNINIKPVDDSFTDNSERFVYNEDSGQHSGDLLKGSSSPDGPLSIKSFSVEGQQGTLDQPFVIAGKGTLTIHQDGTFDFQSAPNYNGPIPQATYTVTDGSGTDVQSTLNINIKPVDDSFTDNSERFVYNEDSGQHSGDLLKGSSSPDGPLSIKSFSVEGQQGTLDQPFVIAGKGTLTIHQDGTFDFQSAPNYNGPIPQATYTVTDGSGTDVQSTLNINIKPVDDSFTDNSERFVYNEDSGQHSGDLLKGSSSPDGPLSIKSFSVEGQQGTLDQPFVIAGKGTLTIHQDGTFDFQSAPNYNGPIPQATYTVTDGSGTDVQSTLNINIKPVDDSFTDNSERFVYNEDSGQHSGDLLKGSSSPDGPLSIKSFSVEGQQGTLDQPFVIAGKGTLTIHQDGTFDFQSAPNYNGPIPQATYTVTDGSGTDVQSTLNINIKPVDDSFTDNSERFVYNEDSGQHSGDLLKGSSSPDGPLSIKSFSVEGQQGTLDQPFVIAGKGTLTIHQDGTFDFQSAPNYNGPIPQATYTVTDGSGTDVQSTLNINIKPVDDSFTDADESNSGDKGKQIVGSVLAGTSSPDGPVTIQSFSINGNNYTAGTITKVPGVGFLVINNDGSYVFRPDGNFTGDVPPIKYTATDGSSTDQSTLQLTVNPDPLPAFSDAGEKYSMKLGTPRLERNLLDNTSIQQSVGQKITVSISDFNIEGQNYQPGQTAHLSCGELTVKQDGSLIFVPAKGFSGSVPQLTYHLTDGTHSGQTSTADIQVNPYQLVDADEWIRGQEGQVISGELTDGAHLDNGGTPQHLEITQVLDPAGKPLNRDAASGHFVGEIHDENNAIAGTLDVDPATGHYTFTPSSHWTGNIGTSNLPPISYLVRDENGVQDGSLLGIKIDPSWVTPPITDHTQIKPGTDAGNVQVGAGEPGTYFLVKEGERFDPNHPQSTVHGEIGDLRVDNHGSVSFSYDASRGNTWAHSHQNLVSMQRVDVDTGSKTSTTLGTIRNPSGRAAGVPGFSHGNAWWKHPITGEDVQKPPEHSSGALGFVERWVVYNAKGEVVGHYYVTADLQVTETVTTTYSSHVEHGGGPPRTVHEAKGSTTLTETSITHIHAGAEAPTAQDRAQNSGTANDAPDGSEPGIDDPMQAYADYFAAIALLGEDTQDALKELHLHSVKLVIDEDFKETIIAETDQGELRLHISDGTRLDTTSLNKDFLLSHPDINIASSSSQEEETNSHTADSHPASATGFAGNTEGSISEESGSAEQQESPSQSTTGVEAANLTAALNKIKDNIHVDTDGAKPGTTPEDIRDVQEPIENPGATNTDNATEQTAAANSGIAAESSQTDGSLLQRLVQKVQNTIAGPTEEAVNPEAQDVATSTLADPFSEPNQVQQPDDLSSSEPVEDYQPLLDPQDNTDHLMQ